MFFTSISQMMTESVDLTLVIRKANGQLTVSTLPKANGLKDEAANHIIPLTLTGNRSPIQYRARLRAGFDRCGKLFVLYTQYAVEWGNSRNDKHGFRSQNRTAEASGTGRYDVGI